MKQFNFQLSTFLIAFAFAAANANAGAYITGFARTTSDSVGMYAGRTVESLDKHNLFDRIFIDAAIGYAFQNGFRLEADIARIGWNTAGEDFKESFKIGAGVGFIRILYDVDVTRYFDLEAAYESNKRLVPYFGLGVRGLNFDVNGSFDVSLTGGLSYRLADSYALDFQYSRVYVNYFYPDGGVHSHYRSWSNDLRAGLRYSF